MIECMAECSIGAAVYTQHTGIFFTGLLVVWVEHNAAYGKTLGVYALYIVRHDRFKRTIYIRQLTLGTIFNSIYFGKLHISQTAENDSARLNVYYIYRTFTVSNAFGFS